MKQFNFSLQRFDGGTFVPDEGTQLLTISGNVLKPASGSVLSGNALSFRTRSSLDTPAPPAKAFNDYSWSEISAIAQAGTGADYFNIGDCKEITLNGNIGNYLTFDNETLCIFILHFNYPMNGVPENNIILSGFKTVLTNGTDVALCDNKFNTFSKDGTVRFNMNHWGGINYGGWKGSDFRYDILGATSTQPSDYGNQHTTSCVGYNATIATLTNPKSNTLLAALPADFRNALRLWSRWIDAKGNKSNVEENIEETIDAVTLLTEFEVSGKRSLANQYEQSHQTWMDYYKNGNSKIKYNHSDSSSAVWWWLASPHYNDTNLFAYVTTVGITNSGYANYSYAVAPAFKV